MAEAAGGHADICGPLQQLLSSVLGAQRRRPHSGSCWFELWLRIPAADSTRTGQRKQAASQQHRRTTCCVQGRLACKLCWRVSAGCFAICLRVCVNHMLEALSGSDTCLPQVWYEDEGEGVGSIAET